MLEFNAEQARKIVTGLGRTQNQIDGALRKFSMLTTDVIDAFSEAQMSDATSQPALEELADGFSSFVAGRRKFVDLHQRLIDMKADSNLQLAEIGCAPGPLCPWKPETRLQLVAS